jgi:hypothetical protein
MRLTGAERWTLIHFKMNRSVGFVCQTSASINNSDASII